MGLLLKYKWWLVGLSMLASFYGGWELCSLYDDSAELKTQKKVQEVKDAFTDSEARKAKLVEDTIKKNIITERVIEREKLKIIDNPIYLNECLDGPGVRLLNRQRGYEDPLAGEPS